LAQGKGKGYDPRKGFMRGCEQTRLKEKENIDLLFPRGKEALDQGGKGRSDHTKKPLPAEDNRKREKG